LKPGKTLDDVARLDREAKRLFAEIGLELSLMRLSPLFNHAMPGQPGADYIDITMGSLKAFGTGWDNWMASKDALKLMVAKIILLFVHLNSRERAIELQKLMHWMHPTAV